MAEKLNVTITVTEPDDGTKVEYITIVRGTYTGPVKHIWLVLHPTAVKEYWFQPQATINADGTWQATAYMGRPNQDVGAVIEVRAFANLQEPKVAHMIERWVKAEASTKKITLTRK